MAGTAPSPHVRVRVEAPAGAHVEAKGAEVPLCDTPCVLDIDPADGGSTIRRDFVVRQDGFVDAPFTVDLDKPPPSIVIALDQIVMPDPTPVEGPTAGETSSGRRDGRRDRPRETGREPVKVTPPPPPPVDPGPGSATPAGGAGAGSGSGSAKKPKDTKVDPTVTIDPFAGGG